MRRLREIGLVAVLLGLVAPAALSAQEPDEEAEAAAEEAKAAAEAAEAEAHEHAVREHERAEARHAQAARAHERMVRALARSRSYLGVALRDVTSDDVGRFGLQQEQGALIESVSDESPAAEAGLVANDVIATWNGQPVEGVAALSRFVRETPAGRTVELGVVREGALREISVELGDRPSRMEALAYRLGPEIRARMEEAREHLGEAREHLREYRERLRECVIEVEEQAGAEGEKRRIVIAHGGRGRMGVRLQGLSEQLGDYFGIEDGRGALVASVRDGSPAATAGVSAGDVIVQVGASNIESTGDVARAVRSAEAGPLEVRLVRRGQERTLTVILPERQTDDCDDIFVAPEGEGPHSHGIHVRPEAPLPPSSTS